MNKHGRRKAKRTENKKESYPQKSMTELTKDHDQVRTVFPNQNSENPNGKEDFEELLKKMSDPSNLKP